MGTVSLLPALLLLGRQSDLLGGRLVGYARSVVSAQLSGRPVPRAPDFGAAKPVFVTIERDGKILGCRGSLSTRTATLGAEIAMAAAAACAHDPRYRPMTRRDLDGFLVTVTVVTSLAPIADVSGLHPDEGLVLTANGKTGIVLPWEGKDPALRLKWAYQKAMLPIGSSATLRRMTGERWRG